MHANSNLTAVKGYLGATIQAAEPDPNERLSHPAITVTRQTGARAINIGNRIISILEQQRKSDSPTWSLFEKDLIGKILQEHNQPVSHEKYYAETSINYIDEVIEQLSGLHTPSFQVTNECHELIRNLCSRGHVIIVGRCGNLLTKHMSNVLKVRFVGSMECRIRHLSESKGIQSKEAENYLKKEDMLRKKYAKEYFGVKDIDSPHDYDIIINTDSLEDQDAAQVVANLILQRT